MAEKKLTPKQEAFCQQYVVDFNATQAAIRAKYSAKSAMELGYQLLQKPLVKQRIAELKDASLQRVEVKQDDVLRELLRMGMLDPRALYRDDGTIKHPKEWPDEIAACIAGIEVDQWEDGGGHTTKVRFWPKDKALNMLGLHLKLFTSKTEHGLSKTLEDLVAGSREAK